MSIEEFNLVQLETILMRGFTDFAESGFALDQINAGKLFDPVFDTFDDYLRYRWNITPIFAHKLISASQIYRDLEPVEGKLPATQAQTRPLQTLTPAERQAAWELAVTNNPGNITALSVEEAAHQVSKPVVKVNYRSVTQSPEWYTPRQYVDAARKVFGGRIDLDPASCPAAQRTVQANVYFDEERNGLAMQWRGRVWLNPPYGRKHVKVWIQKLVDEYAEGNIDQAILLVKNGTETQWFKELWKGSLCFVTGRIRFEGPNRKDGQPHQSPAFGSVFCYFGRNHGKFAEVFAEFGPVFERAGDGLRKFRRLKVPVQ